MSRTALYTPRVRAGLVVRALAGLTFLLAVIAGVLFIAAGTLHYWQAWAFLGVFAACAVAITIDLARRDPALLERRVKAGPAAEPSVTQKIVQSIASLAFLAIFAVAALDHRFGWSHLPAAAAIGGNVLVAIGFAIVFFVFRANTYTSAVIEVAEQQHVVSTGPYAVVRHPMYAGAMVLLVGSALALASWRAEGAVVLVLGVIVLRLLDEERVLAKELAGYAEYRERVRWRLVPFVW